MMTKKHYVAIAEIIRQDIGDQRSRRTHTENSVTQKHAVLVLEGVARRLAYYFESENTRFDRARFLAACGVVL